MTDSKKSEILSFIQNYPNCSSIFDLLDKTPVFTDVELEKLAGLQKKFADNSAQLTPFEYAKEIERWITKRQCCCSTNKIICRDSNKFS